MQCLHVIIYIFCAVITEYLQMDRLIQRLYSCYNKTPQYVDAGIMAGGLYSGFVTIVVQQLGTCFATLWVDAADRRQCGGLF